MRERRLSVALRQEAPIPLDVQFDCEPGDVLAIYGPSGSGKTTILRTIAGLYTPASAVVRSAPHTWTDTAAGATRPPHRREVGFVFQEYALFPHLTALGNVIAALGHRPRQERRRRADTLLEMVQIPSLASRRPHELSGGQRQRVALARALAREPAVLLMDEPFAALDRTSRRALQNVLDRLRRQFDVPVILVTHDLDDVVRLATHVLLLEQGRTVAAGPVTELMSRPDLAFLRASTGLGAVFDAVVARARSDRGLIELAFDGGSLLATAPSPGVAMGTPVRIRVPAREIILATSAPAGLSLHNAVAGVVSAMHAEPELDVVMVQVTVGRVLLLAEVTRDAVHRLNLVIGAPIHALIKSVSIDVRPTSAPDPPVPHTADILTP